LVRAGKDTTFSAFCKIFRENELYGTFANKRTSGPADKRTSEIQKAKSEQRTAKNPASGI